MSVKITTLIENSPGEHHALKAEHGLSFFIEKDGHKFLFDTGQSGAIIENAAQLRVDITSLDYVVLSHGHYDHSGGLQSLLTITTEFKLILGQDFFDKKYSCKKNSSEYIGNNFDEQFLTDQQISYQFVQKNLTTLLPDVYIITCFPRIHEDEVINPRFKILKNGSFQADPFNDEISLVIDTSEGLVVLLGCSHPGMKNMLDFTTKLIKRPIYAVLGGIHLVEATEKSFESSMNYIQKTNLKLLGVSHCTGKVAMDQLAASDRRYFHNHTGSSLFIA
ncbi:MAG: MBL fold metallo-hydrolase [Proteobacteria bacterium]|nr:MBL fold metallo-hydrolase [Pseudomonadota bacterium]MBU1057922.1 MBL fold metallo-hydrolase [Pseudomonadota bacterium]